jgi:hypothetical protein
MSRKLNLAEVIYKFKQIHGDRYRYEKFKYFGSRVKSSIICFKHGEFEQHSNSHLEGNGCPKCGKDKSLNSFILKGSITNNNKSKINFIDKCLLIHKNLDFTKTKYVNKKTPVIVTCKKHGDYSVTPTNLLRGHSCRRCTNENYTEHWTLNGWSQKCLNGIGYFYIILMKNENESFIKCGITNKSVINRKSKLPSKYQKTILFTVENTPEFCFNLEKEINKTFKKNKIIPSIIFCGMYECFDIEYLEKIKKYINDKTK